MSCPFFMPTDEFKEWAWHARPRLPLGEPWRGYCTAPGHERERPSDDEIKYGKSPRNTASERERFHSPRFEGLRKKCSDAPVPDFVRTELQRASE